MIGGKRYVVTATATQPFPGDHRPIQFMHLSAPAGNGADVIIGGSDATTGANGWVIVPKGTSSTALGPFNAGPVYLSDIYVVGTANDILHICYVLR